MKDRMRIPLNSPQNGGKVRKIRESENLRPDRPKFWKFCQRSAAAAKHRAKKAAVPFAIDAYMIDDLLIGQQWRCAVSRIVLEAPRAAGQESPFTPSLDRIVGKLGYVPGNIRVVCSVVNSAMSQFGEDVLWRVVAAMAEQSRPIVDAFLSEIDACGYMVVLKTHPDIPIPNQRTAFRKLVEEPNDDVW